MVMMGKLYLNVGGDCIDQLQVKDMGFDYMLVNLVGFVIDVMLDNVKECLCYGVVYFMGWICNG